MLKISRSLLSKDASPMLSTIVRSMTYEVVDVEQDKVDNITTVRWNDNRRSYFSNAWLRDNAPHPSTIQRDGETIGRKILMQHFDPDVEPISVQKKDRGIAIRWPKMGPYEEFTVHYKADWLRDRDLTRVDKRDKRRDFITAYVHRLLWDKSLIAKVLYTGDYETLLSTDEEMYEFLRRFLQTGLAVIKNVPKDMNALERFFTQFGYMYCDCPFGASYEVKNKLDPANLRDSNRTLGLHLDLPYNSNPPDVQALHIIKQSAIGGESIFTDGFHIARQIADDLPDVYDMLTKTVVEYIDDAEINGTEHVYAARRPVVALDERGQVKRLYFDNQQRSWHILLPVEQHADFYRALKTFNDYAYNAQNAYKIKLDQDEIVLFANSRVLHGRIGCEIGDATASQETERERHIKCCYGSFDQMRSRLRVLQRKLVPDRAQVTM